MNVHMIRAKMEEHATVMEVGGFAYVPLTTWAKTVRVSFFSLEHKQTKSTFV
jgi:hypothetical protein